MPSRFDGYPDTPTAVQAEMAKALHPHVRVRVLVTPGSHEQLRFEAALARAGVPRPLPANITFMPVRHCDIWARDAGPIWLRHRGSGARRMVKPTYTLWGYLVGGPRGRGHVDGPWASCDVPNTVPDQLAPLLGVPVEDASPFKTEGGDKSFNGRGTVLMSLAVERQRHPGLSVASIEKLRAPTSRRRTSSGSIRACRTTSSHSAGPCAAAPTASSRCTPRSGPAATSTRRRASSGRGRWWCRS